MKWLVTAFEPFAGGKTNSSLTIAEELSDLDWQGEVEFHFPVPVTFSSAWKDVLRAIESHAGIQGVLCLGQAEARTKIGVECVALNRVDSSLADNAGVTPSFGKISDGPDMYWTTIPWQEFKLPKNCERSYSAGTYVCNVLFYQLSHWASLRRDVHSGFVHIPLVGPMHLSVADAVASLREILRLLVAL